MSADRAQIRRFVENHPDADAMTVLAQCNLGPAHRDLVEGVLDGDGDHDDPEAVTPSDTPSDTDGGPDTGSNTGTPGGLPSYAQLFDEARECAGTERWEPVTEADLRAVFSKHDGSLDALLDPDQTGEDKPPTLAFNDEWTRSDLASADEPADVRWYHARGDEPRPEEFRRFHDLFAANTPDDYTPHYFRVEAASKAPAVQFGSWKTDEARLTVEEAVDWMEQGGNIGIGGRPDGPLVNLDVDDEEETTPDDLPATLRAISRSRTGFHAWFFNPVTEDAEDAIPNIPTDTAGEVRADWQYVVAPGSFVASASEEIPDAADDPGYYTVEEESPVETMVYDDLPRVFREFDEGTDEPESEHEHDADSAHDTPPTGEQLTTSSSNSDTGYDSDSAVFDVTAEDVLRKAGGSTATSGRFSSVFHGSSTNANMALSDTGKLQCWRHNVAHGGLQALAALSKHSPSGDTACRQIGKAHKNAGSGRNRYKGDWQLVWWAWSYAKRRGHIPGDDPIPRSAHAGLAVKHDVCDAEDVEDGWKLPADAYNDAIELVDDEYGLDPGRDPFTGGWFGSGGDAEQTVVIPDPPNSPVELADQHAQSSEWNWRAASAKQERERENERNGGGDHDLTLDSARERTREAIGTAYETGDRVLIEALMTLGKSYGAIAAAADTSEPITYLTNRGNSEQYAEAKERCEKFDLSYAVLPSAFRECPTFRGDHGREVKDRVRNVYERGATAKDIHVHATDHLDETLPCEQGEGQCPWKQAWAAIEPDDVDVLIGHYSHSHVMSATKSRTVAFDEFPDGAFETTFQDDDEYELESPGNDLATPVSHFLSNTPGLDIEDYADLMAARDDDERRADALNWFLSHVGDKQPGRDPGLAFSTNGHALAPLAAFVLLAGGASKNNLGNGWEHIDFDGLGNDEDFDGWRGAYDRENNAIHLLKPPTGELRYSSGVVALDGTPTKMMWQLSLGSRLNHRQVLSDPERIDYLADVLDHNYVVTTAYTKTYSGGEHVYPQSDAALFEWIHENYGVKPGLITTVAAQKRYHHADAEDMPFELELNEKYDVLNESDDYDDVVRYDELVDDYDGPIKATKHHGDILGSNEFDQTRIGVLTGSRHYGDDYVKKWAAFAGESTKRKDETEQGKGTNLDFTGFGGDVFRHMTEHQTLQAAMRFGRDGLGAVTFVHTDTLPEWVVDSRVVERRPGVVRTYSDGERQVLDALTSDEWDRDEWRSRHIADHPDVLIGARQVRTHLSRLAERDVLHREYDGNGFVYQDTGLHHVNERGEVELEPEPLELTAGDELVPDGGTDGERWDGSEVAGTIVNTWNFRPPDELPPSSSDSSAGGSPAGGSLRSDGGDPPPTPGS